MSRKDEIDFIYALGTTKKKGWQQSDNPCLAADYGDLEKAWSTMTKTYSDESRESLLQEIELSVRAQAVFRRDSRRVGDHVPQPKLIASWIRKKRWRDQIESHADLKKKTELNKCKCGQLVIGPTFTECAPCHMKTLWDVKGTPIAAHAIKMRKWYKENKEYADSNGAEMVKRFLRGI